MVNSQCLKFLRAGSINKLCFCKYSLHQFLCFRESLCSKTWYCCFSLSKFLWFVSQKHWFYTNSNAENQEKLLRQDCLLRFHYPSPLSQRWPNKNRFHDVSGAPWEQGRGSGAGWCSLSQDTTGICPQSRVLASVHTQTLIPFQVLRLPVVCMLTDSKWTSD